jgi:hypothetical protein
MFTLSVLSDEVSVNTLYLKKKIPSALKEQVWINYNNNNFNHKCMVRWCENILTPFTFEVGHNIPESKGGTTNIDNLRPICSKCNKSMGSQYSIDEFSKLSERKISKITSKDYMKKFRLDPFNVFNGNRNKILSKINNFFDYKANLQTLKKYNISQEEVTIIRTEKNFKPFDLYHNYLITRQVWSNGLQLEE